MPRQKRPASRNATGARPAAQNFALFALHIPTAAHDPPTAAAGADMGPSLGAPRPDPLWETNGKLARFDAPRRWCTSVAAPGASTRGSNPAPCGDTPSESRQARGRRAATARGDPCLTHRRDAHHRMQIAAQAAPPWVRGRAWRERVCMWVEGAPLTRHGAHRARLMRRRAAHPAQHFRLRSTASVPPATFRWL